MEYKNIIFEKRDGIGYVTMNRERALNALNTEVLTELDHVFCAIDQDEEVKIAIITGKGRAFIAGADIGQMAKLSGPRRARYDYSGAAGDGTYRIYYKACDCSNQRVCTGRRQ